MEQKKYPNSIKEFTETLQNALQQIYEVREAGTIARQWIEYITGISWFQLNLQNRKELTASEYQASLIAAIRLEKGEPLQYVTGIAWFYGRSFSVGPEVLIPRGETEELMVWVRDTFKGKQKYSFTLLDIGTGSGCIPISLDLETQKWGGRRQFIGIDISEDALSLARYNSEQLGASVNFIGRDIFQAGESDFNLLDVVVSNPPYIPQGEGADIHINVKKFEPHQALFVPDDDPLRFYRRIIASSTHWLNPQGYLFFEIHENFGEELVALLESQGWREIELRKDLNGKDRMIRALRPK